MKTGPAASAASAASAALTPPSKLGIFWAQLSNAKLEKVDNSTWLTLPGEATWFGIDNLGSYLLVRRVYENFWEVLQESKVHYVFTGTPGIGKSFFSLYLFWKIRIKHPTATIVLKDDDTHDFKVFLPDGRTIIEQYHNISTILENPNNWYIVDAIKPLIVNARTVLVTSPLYPRYKEFLKKGVEIRFMPTWDADEIYAMCAKKYQHTHDSQENLAAYWGAVKELAAYWGGVPRTLFPAEGTLAATNFLNSIEVLVKDLSQCFEYVDKSVYPNEVVSGRVLHLRTEEPYMQATTRFASNKMGNELLMKYGSQLRDKISQFLSASAGHSALGGLRGTLFEPAAHRSLIKGGLFEVRDLETNEETAIVFTSAEHHMFHHIFEIRSQCYNQPVIPNFESVFALIPPTTLFQMTTGDKHPIQVQGLKDLTRKLDTTSPIRLYFLLPSDKFQNFTKQPYHTKERQVYRRKEIFLDNIQQFALKIDMSMDSFANLYGWNDSQEAKVDMGKRKASHESPAQQRKKSRKQRR